MAGDAVSPWISKTCMIVNLEAVGSPLWYLPIRRNGRNFGAKSF